MVAASIPVTSFKQLVLLLAASHNHDAAAAAVLQEGGPLGPHGKAKLL